ncbi:MAG TPA: amylo-alpha-1,6-glucosidase [Puia sp.]|jgi:predicted glycogen debranching enzyme|nr:amylo-alpha-1,6-glucosidase [Puia sp.]
MLIFKDKNLLENFSETSQLEWLETNGLGGWSGSSLSGCNTRRYHGLLMAAIHPPAERMLLVSKLDETIIINDNHYDLGTNDYGDVVFPSGFQFLSSFKKGLFPEWIFEITGLRLRKTITMVNGENTTLIRYEVLNATSPFILQLLPLIAARGYHELQHSYNNIFWKVDFKNGLFHNQPFNGAPEIYISVPGSSFQPVNKWYFKFNYLQEKYRGLDYGEDLFNHGTFHVELKDGDALDIIISTEDPTGKNPDTLFEMEKHRKLSLLNRMPGDLLRTLSLAADQFIVKREIPGESETMPVALKTVIAGYHWFTDWGRDTMISLPGLCLQSGRYEDAKKIISVFAKSVSMGMLPNRFKDNNDPPEYNNVDGTLWYFNAVYAYLQYTNDRDFILKEILPVLKDIIQWHFKGTRFNIHVDSDGLLYAGEAGQQLTWMDARIGNWVVTPRMGKPVEIEALWYNALKIFEGILLMNGESESAYNILEKAEQAKKSFSDKFWYTGGNYLYDNIDESGMPDASLRPNQVFAISLPFHLIEGERAEAVLKIIRSKLYTPVGLRSLSPDDPKYKGIYEGNSYMRDSAYHQGTVWSWLLGPFVEAWMKTAGDQFKEEALAIIQRFIYHLGEACIGTVSEIFDGDAPYHPRGCVAQAWGVAEILRVINAYSLFHAGS